MKNKITGYSILILALVLCFTFTCDAYGAGTEKTVKVKILNNNVDSNMKEIVYLVKNKKKSAIKVKKVIVEKKVNNIWTELERKQDANVSRNIKVASKSSEYDSLQLNLTYKMENGALEDGTYRLTVKYKHKGKSFYIYKTFKIKNAWGTRGNEQENETETSKEQESQENETETSKEQETNPGLQPDDSTIEELPTGIEKPVTGVGNTNSTGTAEDTATTTTATNSVDNCLMIQDFNINKKGKASILAYYESDYTYECTDKVVMRIKIQRKTKKGWRNYKTYKIKKKSNVAFVNKKINLKKSGTYRMKVKVTQYEKGIKRESFSTRYIKGSYKKK